MHRVAFIILLGLAASAGAKDHQQSRTECAQVKEKIRNVQSEMRAGYTRARGEKLEARLRKLRKQRKKICH